jgi:hypothetical protein
MAQVMAHDGITFAATSSQRGAVSDRFASLGRVQGRGGANERLQRLLIDLVGPVDIDGAPGVAFEAGIEEA